MKNNILLTKLVKFVDGEVSFEPKAKKQEVRRESTHKEKTIAERYAVWHQKDGYNIFRRAYVIASCFIAVCIITTLLVAVSYMPPYGQASNPANNEVTERYIEKGMEETGAVNIVAGVILPLDTFMH